MATLWSSMMNQSDSSSPRTLGGILLNPPLTTGAATMRHLGVAAEILGCENVQVANLFAIPTISVTEINEAGRSADGWEAARGELARVVDTSAELVAGWGVSGLHGPAAAHRNDQLVWLIEQITTRGQPSGMWTLNGEARHPSRWHQYVSDRHGRASGPTFHERLTSVLRRVVLSEWPPLAQHDTAVVAS
jgi:Protein of unknown function (DUF1643)